MAQKPRTSMAENLAEFKDLKNIDKDTMVTVLQDSFRSVLSKMFGTDENYTVIVSPETGDFEIWRDREVVEGIVEDPNMQVSIVDALKIDPDAQVGEIVTDQIDFNSFGRRAILNLKQALAGKIMDRQKEALYNEFKEKIGSIITAEVYQVWKREVLLMDDEGNELLLPRSEQIPGDFFRKGDNVRSVVDRVDNENNVVKIYVSRTSPEFLKRLFEQNVPEIADGLITIRRVARLPGERAKMAVESYDERIDPVGACVGMNGSRIRSIVRELRGENIDVFQFTSNPTLFIQRALSPAKLNNINILPDEMRAEVSLPPEEVPMAIGKNASNIKLAKALTGYDIEVFRDVEGAEEEDIYLDEFNDEIEQWIIDALKGIGCNTAKSVLRIPRERLEKRTDLEMSTINNVLNILSSEFEEQELDEIGYRPLHNNSDKEQVPNNSDSDDTKTSSGDENAITEAREETPIASTEASPQEQDSALE